MEEAIQFRIFWVTSKMTHMDDHEYIYRLKWRPTNFSCSPESDDSFRLVNRMRKLYKLSTRIIKSTKFDRMYFKKNTCLGSYITHPEIWYTDSQGNLLRERGLVASYAY